MDHLLILILWFSFALEPAVTGFPISVPSAGPPKAQGRAGAGHLNALWFQKPMLGPTG